VINVEIQNRSDLQDVIQTKKTHALQQGFLISLQYTQYMKM